MEDDEGIEVHGRAEGVHFEAGIADIIEACSPFDRTAKQDDYYWGFLGGALMRHTVWFFVSLFPLLCANSAGAQNRDQDVKFCNALIPESTDDNGIVDSVIVGCSKLILSGQDSPADLTKWYFNRGMAYVGKALYDKAIADFTKAIEVTPERSNMGYLYGVRAVADFWGKHYDASIEDYTMVISADPTKAEAYGNRGDAYKEKHLYDHAITDNTKAIDLYSRYYIDNLIGRALAYHLEGKDDRGLSDANMAIAINPLRQEFYETRGDIYAALEQPELALADYLSSARLDPKNHSARDKIKQLISLYDVRAMKLRYSDLFVQSSSLTREQRKQALALFSDGFRSWKSGDFASAEIAFRKGLNIDPANGSANYYYSDCLRRDGNQITAAEYISRATAFGGILPEVYK